MNAMQHSKDRRRMGAASLAVLLSLALMGGPACDNFLGLEDWQRDLFNHGFAALGTGGALAAALLTGGTTTTPGPSPDPLPGVEGPQGEQGVAGEQGLPGADGVDGADGEDGTELFHVFVDDFFGWRYETDISKGPLVVQINEPALDFVGGGTPGNPDPQADRVAFRVMIPPDYEGANPVTLRLAFRRLGGAIGPDPFVYDIFIRRLVDGANEVEDYVNPPVRTISMTPPEAGNEFEFQIVDLPLNVAVPNGLGGAALSAGDYIAVELVIVDSDGGAYRLLAAEFYETADAPPVNGATIL